MILFYTSNSPVIVTQGFIGASPDNNTTTFGREGSDFTAALLANMLDAKLVTIWKDVAGVYNGDPKEFSFIAEDKLSHIFAIFSGNNKKVNLMQNTAISFSVSINKSSHFSQCIQELQQHFTLKYNDLLELITIRHYSKKT